jgi:hypothetical protein
MKKMIAFGTVLLFCICLANANATLIKETNSKGTVVYDNVAKVYWVQDTQFLVALSYADQLKKIDDLNSSSYFGITTWKMATLPKMTQLWSNPANEFLEFYRTYVEGGTDYYYGRYDSAAGNETHYTARVVDPIWMPPDSLMAKMPLEANDIPDWYSWQTAQGGGPGYPAAWVFADLPCWTRGHPCGTGDHHRWTREHHRWNRGHFCGIPDLPLGTSDSPVLSPDSPVANPDSPVANPDSPVANPEPGTLLLLGSGVLAWALCRKRVKS